MMLKSVVKKPLINTIIRNKSVYTPIAEFISAASEGNLEALKKIIAEEKIDVNKSDYDKRTALHLAASQGHLNIVKYLVEEKGANIGAVDKFHHTPLEEALEMNKYEVVKYLHSKVKSSVISESDDAKLKKVVELIQTKGVFSPALVVKEVEYFFKELIFHPSYFTHYAPEQIALHVTSLMAAKKVSQSTAGVEDNIWLISEKENEAIYMCQNTAKAESEMENVIDKFILATPKDHGYSLEYFTSKKPIVNSGSCKLSIYTVIRYPFADKEAASIRNRDKTEKTIARYEESLKEASNSLAPVIKSFEAEPDGTVQVMIAIQDCADVSYFARMSELIDSIPDLKVERKFVETFQEQNGTKIYSLYVRTTQQEKIDELINKANLLTVIPDSQLNRLLFERKLTSREVLYGYSAFKFTYYFTNELSDEFIQLSKTLQNDKLNSNRLVALQAKLKKDAFNETSILKTIMEYPEVMHEIYADFSEIFEKGKRPPAFNEELWNKIKKQVYDPIDRTILQSFLKFNASIYKTNFYVPSKGAVAYRLNPAEFLKGSPQYKDVPYGIIMIIGREFNAFHVRFRDVSRGGIRVIKSANMEAFQKNQGSVFTENYNLSSTQQRKNKDIPEGGSKGTILLHPDYNNSGDIAFKKYVDSILDLVLLQDKRIFDYLKKPEILYLGPDENSAHLMNWAALHAKSRGAPWWKAITTGKSPTLGGIPHDTYGMTTNSTHECVLGVLRKLGIKEQSITKLQTGGPDGDLGSNEILISYDKTVGIVDGSGVVYDPNGLSRDELKVLTDKRVMIKEFDEKKLSPQGFKVLVGQEKVTLPNGFVVESGLEFRNNFHLNPLFEADLFVPAGGRPDSINISNVHKLFKRDGTPKIKYIVEGANLFISPDARLYLEERGVVLIKDATANKGGVTSSSKEVLAALALNGEEFEKHMCVKDGVIPEFYKKYVDYSVSHIRENAYLEFEALWKEAEKSGKPRSIITDELSQMINSINDEVQNSALWENKKFVKNVMLEALPKPLLDLLGLETMLERIPESYLKAIFGAHIASRYVYTYGPSVQSPFAFHEFITKYM